MREILFRGKTEKGEWVEGSFINSVVKGSPFGYIAGNNVVEPVQVMRKTVGQYTGITDKNGKKIFEGDILEITERGTTVRGGLVRFEYGYAGGWVVCDPKKQTSHCTLSLRKDVEVIGNVHDNPEWLEVENG